MHSAAKSAKQDEFYTQYVDIQKEVEAYLEFDPNTFRGKIVYCNCDDPFESNFFKYFAMNFNTLGLKKLIATTYIRSPIVGGQLPLLEIAGLRPDAKEPYAIEINAVPDSKGSGTTDLSDVEFLLRHDANVAKTIQGDATYGPGDFRSSQSVAFLNEADVVVTNPPFSLFREYVEQLVAHSKQFLIIGSKNAISYKEVFSLIQANKFWIGTTPMGVDMLFDVPPDYAEAMIASGKEGSSYRIVDGLVKGRSPSAWFTNMDNPKRHSEIPLWRKYSPDDFPTYHNYPAIEVGKVSDIPDEYMGEMGVPVTFLDKYNPNQFEILGSSATLGKPMTELAPKGSFLQGGPRFYLADGDGTYRRLYDRIVIRRKV